MSEARKNPNPRPEPAEEKHRSRSYRTACPLGEESRVRDLLAGQGYDPVVEPYSPLAWSVSREPVPLGSSVAARFGLIYIQDRSSMLAPLALAPRPGERILDMCASPGGKSGFAAMLAGPSGLVVANEPSRERLATMRGNLKRQNLLNTVTCSYPGQDIPLPDRSFSAILLDPPCSGWGVADKHPRVRQLWTGDKVEPLVKLQKELLQEAERLLAPGGRIIYSTCTTNVAENEDQVLWARTELGFELSPLEQVPGMAFSPPERSGAQGVLRVDASLGNDQGHFVARLVKPGRAREDDDTGGELPKGGQELALEEMMPGRLNLASLAHGRVAQYGDRAFYLPEAALSLDGDSFKWQGTVLGRTARGRVRLAPGLRMLCPEYDPRDGLDIARLEGVSGHGPTDGFTMLEGLFTGRSVQLEKGCFRGVKELFLYFDSLPLARVLVKNGRLVLHLT